MQRHFPPLCGDTGGETMTTRKAVLFDLDGTLLDTIPDIAGALNRALTLSGLPTHPVRAFEGFVGGGIREAVVKASPAGTEEAVLERVLTAYHDIYVAHCTDETDYYPGVRELLAQLERRGLLLGVLSNKTEATARKIVAHYFPEIQFRCVFGRAAGRPLKPDPAAAWPALEALALSPADIIYVGDSGTDMVFAQNVGMLPVAAPWGYRSREELAGRGAVALPESPAALLAWITGGGGNVL